MTVNHFSYHQASKENQWITALALLPTASLSSRNVQPDNTQYR